MAGSGKRIVVSSHAAQRMRQRGATTVEVERAIREGAWQPVRRGKLSAAYRFAFDAVSPVNGKRYTYKKVEAIFADKPAAVVVVTVKVYYHN